MHPQVPISHFMFPKSQHLLFLYYSFIIPNAGMGNIENEKGT